MANLDSHDSSPYSIFCAWPWDQQPNGILSRDSQMGIPKFSKLRFLRFWGPITLSADFLLRWGLRQSCSPRWGLSNSMSHTTYTLWNRSNYRLLVVGSQTASLTPSPFLGHNSLKVRESIGTPTPKMGAHLGMWGLIPSHFPTPPGAQDVTLELPSWPAPLQALALVVNPRLGLWPGLWSLNTAD